MKIAQSRLSKVKSFPQLFGPGDGGSAPFDVKLATATIRAASGELGSKSTPAGGSDYAAGSVFITDKGALPHGC